MSKCDRPMADDEKKEVASHIADALRILSVAEGEMAPDGIQVVIRHAIDVFHSMEEEVRAASLDHMALKLGCLWGQSVCDQLGWQWACVRLGPDWEGYGVVAPGRSHVVFPLRYVRGLLADAGRDQTSRLLYNMLKAGSLPSAEPASYQVLR